MAEVRVVLKADGSGLTGTLRIARSEFDALQRELGETSTAAKRAATDLDRAGTAAASGTGSVKGLAGGFNTLRTTLAGLGLGLFAREMLQTADTMAGINARLKLVTTDTASFATAQQRVFDIAQKSATSIESVATLYTRLSQASQSLGYNQEKVANITEAVAVATRLSGTSAASASAGITQLAQAFASGVLSGDEFRSVMENSPRVVQALVESTGLTVGSLRKLAEQQLLTADVVAQSLLLQQRKLQQEIEGFPLTVGAALQQANNAWSVYVDGLLNASGETSALAGVISGLADILKDEAQAAREGGGSSEILAGALKFVVLAAVTLKNGVEGLTNVIAGLVSVSSAVTTAIITMFKQSVTSVSDYYSALRSFDFAAAAAALDTGIRNNAATFTQAKAEVTGALTAMSDGWNSAVGDVTDAFERLNRNQSQVKESAKAATAAEAELRKEVERLQAQMQELLKSGAAKEAADKRQKEEAKQEAAHVREKTAAQAEYARILSQLLDEIDPLNAAEREYAELSELATGWAKARFKSEEAVVRLLGLKAEVIRKNNAAERERVERPFMERGYQAQEQREEELNRMREEIKLIGTLGEARERLIDLFDAERAAMGLVGPEREKYIRDFMRLRAEMRGAAQDSSLASEWADNWKSAIQDVFQSFIGNLKNGQSFGDALANSIKGAMDGILDKNIKKFSDALGQWATGGGTGGLTARGANGMSVAANGALSMLGAIGQNYIGNENTATSALGGAAYGASIGMAAGPIGAAIGAVIGAVVGAISSQKPYLEVSSSASNINRGRVEGSATSAFGSIYVGKDDLTLPGNMSSQELANNIAKFDDTIAKLLDATEVAAARQALARFDVNQSGSGAIDPEKILEQRLRAVINAVEPEFARFLNGITDIQERVETFTALRELRTVIEDFGSVVDSLSLDPLVTLQNSLQRLDDVANEAVEGLYAALDSKDVKGAAVALGQAQQALVNQYQAQITMVQQLRQQLIALADAERNFRMEMAQRINANGGNISIAGMVGADLPGLQASVTNEQNTERAINNLNRFIQAVDQWLAASIGEIQAAAQAARDRIAAQLSALDAEEAGIMANAQAAMNAAQSAAQGAADAARAALEAERARLQRELQVAQAFQSVLQTAETMLANLRLSAANPLAESARAAMLERDIEAARASYGSATGEERAAAAQRLLELLQQRMQFAQSLNQRPSEEYLRIYNATVAETAGLRTEAQAQADRARALQEELNALQSANVDATNNVANVIDYVSVADRQRLAEIETERTRLQNELAEINRKEAEDIAAARAEARGYYEWAQSVGEDLYQRRHEELLAQVNAITGGREIDVFIAEQTAAVQERLREIRDRLDAFLDGISTNPGGGSTNPGTGPGAGNGNPRVPGDPGIEPVIPRGSSVAPVTQSFTFNVSAGTDAKAFGEQVLRIIENNSPRIRRAVAT